MSEGRSPERLCWAAACGRGYVAKPGQSSVGTDTLSGIGAVSVRW
jgi:hypothetical protein